MEPWLTMIRDVGFPIVVTFFLLYRIESKLDELIQSVRNLSRIQAIRRPDEADGPKIEQQG
ncbi:YvrJ family protein [Sporolactobacillus sp. THM7-7]|nr:YvrJ family protein [Sporolactobacillus sp. THM7-7]